MIVARRARRRRPRPTAANRFAADVYLGFEPPTEPARRDRLLRRRRRSSRPAADAWPSCSPTSSAPSATLGRRDVRGMRLPVLRETRMPAVRVRARAAVAWSSTRTAGARGRRSIERARAVGRDASTLTVYPQRCPPGVCTLDVDTSVDVDVHVTVTTPWSLSHSRVDGSGDRVGSGSVMTPVDPLEVLEVGELDRRPCPAWRPSSTSTRVSRWSASSSSSSSRPGGRRRVAGSAGAVGRAGARRVGRRRPARRAVADRLLDRAHRPVLGARPAGPASPGTRGRACRAAPGRGRRESWPSATRCWIAGGQLEQAQGVGDRRPALADPAGDLARG